MAIPKTSISTRLRAVAFTLSKIVSTERLSKIQVIYLGVIGDTRDILWRTFIIQSLRVCILRVCTLVEAAKPE